MLLAWWLRDPLIPYGGDSTGASSFSADSGLGAEPGRRAGEAVEAMSAAVQAEHRKLARIASSALAAPSASKEAFDHLGKLPHSPAQGVLLLDGGQPTAWAGQTRQTPRPTGAGTSVEFSDFYVTLQVVADKGDRRAIATSLLHAEPPADGIAKTLESLLPEREFVQGFRYRPGSDTTAGSIITGATGSPLFRLEADPLSSERMRFATTAAARGKGVSLLALIVFVMIAVGWFDRRKLMRRLFTLAVAAIAVAIIPWNTFSNLSRAFDPAFFYSRLLGPYTASSGVVPDVRVAGSPRSAGDNSREAYEHSARRRTRRRNRSGFGQHFRSAGDSTGNHAPFLGIDCNALAAVGAAGIPASLRRISRGSMACAYRTRTPADDSSPHSRHRCRSRGRCLRILGMECHD